MVNIGRRKLCFAGAYARAKIVLTEETYYGKVLDRA
jgi:hypothetical protein